MIRYTINMNEEIIYYDKKVDGIILIVRIHIFNLEIRVEY